MNYAFCCLCSDIRFMEYWGLLPVSMAGSCDCNIISDDNLPGGIAGFDRITSKCDDFRLSERWCMLYRVVSNKINPTNITEEWDEPPGRIALKMLLFPVHKRKSLDTDFACIVEGSMDPGSLLIIASLLRNAVP